MYAPTVPIYEYRCAGCNRRSSILTLRVGEAVDPVCRHCGARRLQRLMSRFATMKSEDARLEALADPSSLGGLDENDPKSMARWMRRMGKEMGEDVADEGFDEMVDQMEAGGLAEDGDAGSNDDL